MHGYILKLDRFFDVVMPTKDSNWIRMFEKNILYGFAVKQGVANVHIRYARQERRVVHKNNASLLDGL